MIEYTCTETYQTYFYTASGTILAKFKDLDDIFKSPTGAYRWAPAPTFNNLDSGETDDINIIIDSAPNQRVNHQASPPHQNRGCDKGKTMTTTTTES